MRFTRPKPNEKRTRKWFALLPVTLNYETRWLETVEVEQTYIDIWNGETGEYWWYNAKFLNK